MDNILIFGGWMKEQHHTIVVKVLNILQKHRLYLKAEKCISSNLRSNPSVSSSQKAK